MGVTPSSPAEAHQFPHGLSAFPFFLFYETTIGKGRARPQCSRLSGI